MVTADYMTEAMKIENVVRQGDALSTTLLHVVLEGIVRERGCSRTIMQSSTQIIAYATILF